MECILFLVHEVDGLEIYFMLVREVFSDINIRKKS